MRYKHSVKREKAGYHLFFSIILSVAFVLTVNMHFSGGVWGTIEENYVNNLDLIDFLVFLAACICFYIVLGLTDPLVKRTVKRLSAEAYAEKKKQIIAVWLVILLAAWLPYYLSYYPGGVYADTLTSITFAQGGVLSNRHPFLYTELIALILQIGTYFNKDINWSIGILLLLQMTVLGAELLYFLYWMLKHKIHRILRRALMAFMVFFPLIPLYGISIWKDTLFCMTFFSWMLFIVDLFLEVSNGSWKLRTLIGYGVSALGVAFTRNNGVYVILLSVLCFAAATWKAAIKRKRILNAGLFGILAAILLIQGPIYSIVGVEQTDEVERLGIPLQQIGSVVANDGNITEEQKEIIDRFIPYEQIKPNFSPALADHLKWYTDFDEEYLESHMDEFWDVWFSLLKQNPGLYIKEYLLITAGFWNVRVSSPDAYVQDYIWDNFVGLKQTDYFKQLFGFSFQDIVRPRHYISGAWFFWLFLGACFFTMRHYGWRVISIFMPAISLWLTLMIATPIAISLRYIAALLFALPMILLIPILLERNCKSSL